MQQTEPMPGFMHRRATHVVARQIPVRQGRRQDRAPVLAVFRGRAALGRAARVSAAGRVAAAGRVGDRGRERAVAEDRLTLGLRSGGAAGGDGARGRRRARRGRQVGLEVEVQGRVATFAERGFHARGVRIRRPGVVDGEGVRVQTKGNVQRRVGRVEDIALYRWNFELAEEEPFFLSFFSQKPDRRGEN